MATGNKLPVKSLRSVFFLFFLVAFFGILQTTHYFLCQPTFWNGLNGLNEVSVLNKAQGPYPGFS